MFCCRISNVLLVCFVLFYLAASIGFYLQYLENWNQKEYDNVFNDRREDCKCHCSEKNNAKEFLKLFKDYRINEELDSMSSCRILMDDEVILRAMKYGSSKISNYGKTKPLEPDTKSKRRNKTGMKDCRPLGFSQTSLPMTALASFPGSGNTWVRHLLQQATGKDSFLLQARGGLLIVIDLDIW